MAGEDLNGTAIVTGAAGFIGSHLVQALVSKGLTVNAWCRQPERAWRLKEVSSRIAVQQVDLSHSDQVRAALKGLSPDYVFHLAANRSVERGADQIGPSIQNNLLGTMNLFSAIMGSGKSVRQVINTGSSEEYGMSTPPLHEDLRETPVSPYSASKVAATHYAQMLARSFGFPVVTLRPFLTYGPAQDTDMFIPSLISHALGGTDFKMTIGTQIREYNFVSDIVDGFLLAAAAKQASGHVINLGNGEGKSIAEVAELIVKKTGGSIKLLKGALPTRTGESSLYCSNAKALSLLGWRPKVSLNQGLDRTIDWYTKRASKAELGSR